MWDVLARVFATPKSIEKTMDAVIATGDKLVFTKEEKAEHQAQLGEWYLRYLEATQPQALSRRLLAFLIGFMWSAIICTAIACALWTGDYGSVGVVFNSAGAEELAKQSAAGFLFAILSEVVDVPFTAVVIFYFGGHYLTESLRKIYKDKKD